MAKDYWSKVFGNRISRRRALAASGALTLVGGIVAACGDGKSGGDSSGLLSQPVDTTKQAKRGGILVDRALADPASMDVTIPSNPWNHVGPIVYSSLVQFGFGYLKPSENEVIGSVVESWEWSPDGLQISLKLRQGVKWHNKPPVNGRAFDIDDVLFSWDRFARLSSQRAAILNALNPEAAIISLTATDSKTLVLKLKEPLVYALGLIASNQSGGLIMVPKETDTTFDIRSDMIGTGPFIMANFTPSVGFTLKRHPEYYDKDWALVEQVEKPFVPEYSAALAQFKAGNIYSFGSHPNAGNVTQEDVLPIKRETPDIAIYPGTLRIGGGGSPGNLAFGWLPEGKSPFLDERVRQAVSMSLDRDLYIDTFNNVSSFEAAGLPVETRWHSHLASTTEGWWLDPRGKEFGPNAKYFKHDIAEAKKLLAAAGHPTGFKTNSRYVTGLQLGDLYVKSATVMDGMIGELGITPQIDPIDYAREYTPNYRDGRGQWEGWAYKTSAGGVTGGSAIGALASQFWSKAGSPAFHGFSATGRNDLAGDPQVDAMIEKGRVERDPEKQRALVFDLQRYLAKTMYAVFPPGLGSTFAVAWPCVRNFRVFEGENNWMTYRLWIDKTKPPFKA